MRLIDADAFERQVMFGDEEDLQDVIYALRDFPTFDLAEHDKQVIEEVIEEYKKKIESEEKWLIERIGFNPYVTIAFTALQKYVEQLKEQKK